MPRPLRHAILIVDDHPMMRHGLRQLLSLEPDLEVVGDAANGEEALVQQRRLQPELILLDNRMPMAGGVEAVRDLRRAGYAGRILLFTVSDAPDEVRAAMRHGADGYLLKDMEPEELVQQIRDCLHGDIVISERLAGLLREGVEAPELPSRYDLTPREGEVLGLLVEGKSNRAVAEALGITEGTVKVHVKNLLAKLGLRSRVEAVLWALEHLRS